MRYDDALLSIGEFGHLQRLLFVLSGGTSITVSFCTMAYVFVAASPDHWCTVPDLDTANLTEQQVKHLTLPSEPKADEQHFSQCMMYETTSTNYSLDLMTTDNHMNQTLPVIACQYGWTYDTSQYRTSIVMDWDLVCDRRALVALSQSLYMFGVMLGVLTSGLLSDRFGRRKIIIFCLVMNAVTYILSPFSVNLTMFMVLRLLIGFSIISATTSIFVLAMELTGPNWRVIAGVGCQYFWVFGNLLVAALAYALREWRQLTMVSFVFFLSYIPLIIFVPESPRWLYSKGRVDEANALLIKIAKFNRRPVPHDLDITIENSQSSTSFRAICRYPRLLLRAIIMFFIWLVCSTAYYGLYFNTSNMAGNDYVNFLISAAIEIPATLLCNAFLNRLGRRLMLSISMMLCAGALLLCTAVPDQSKYSWVLVTLATVGKLGITSAFTIVYVYTTEIFPTGLRNTGVAMASFCSRIGAIMAPQLVLLGTYNKYIPLVVFGILCLLAGVFCFALPETANTSLPETLKDANDLKLSRNKTMLTQNGGAEVESPETEKLRE